MEREKTTSRVQFCETCNTEDRRILDEKWFGNPFLTPFLLLCRR